MPSPASNPTPPVDGTVEYAPVVERPGSVIGPYKLMEQIGEGAFGLVFVAEQHRPVRRKVALKIIKPGMDTKEVVARFEAERQALALMNHPNIAQVWDAGTTDSGRPYFVMELIKGIPITGFCDQQQLSTDERLRLYISVCHAVQHAHTKGVIHRDLKPTNILISPHDGAPVVKVIDFGIAKAIGQQLSEKTIYTSFAQMIGTPLYMSPEQAEINALDVDTRSDVYSLGVLLYELLTGTTPFDRERMATAAFDEIRRMIREEEPVRPSTRLSTLSHAQQLDSPQRRAELAKRSAAIKGDLDWIVMKALEKNRERRYETANALAMDVEHHLNDQPIEARPPSTLYRLQKAWRRNKLAFLGSAAVACALVIGAIAGFWMALDENQLRRETEAELYIFKAQRAILESNGEDLDGAKRLLDAIEPEFYKPDLLHAGMRRALGIDAAINQRWREAAVQFAVLVQVNVQMSGPASIAMDHLRYGPVLVRLDRLEEYDVLRSAALDRFATADDPIFVEELLRACLLTPASPALLEKCDTMQQVLERAQQSDELRVFFRPWGCLALALLEHRRGNWEKSVAWCEKERSYKLDAQNPCEMMTDLILAMNRHQLGALSAAQDDLRQIGESIESLYSPDDQHDPLLAAVAGWGWFDWEYVFVLQREAEKLLDDPAGG